MRVSRGVSPSHGDGKIAEADESGAVSQTGDKETKYLDIIQLVKTSRKSILSENFEKIKLCTQFKNYLDEVSRRTGQ